MSINGDRKKRLKTENIESTATDESGDGTECRAIRSGYLSIQNYIRGAYFGCLFLRYLTFNCFRRFCLFTSYFNYLLIYRSKR